MTELEKATQAYCQEHNDDCFEAIGDECPFIGKAFKAGAEWQKKQLIEKAYEWLKIHMPFGEVDKEFRDEIIKDFRKAMEDKL